MTLEELKKHARPLAWENHGWLESVLLPMNCMDVNAFVCRNPDGTWFSYADHKDHPTMEEAMQSVEEYHLRELAKFFEIDDETEQEQS